MSRTYRKTHLTETTTKQEYINQHMSWKNRQYKIDCTVHTENYERALEDYDAELRTWRRSGCQPHYKMPREPYKREFMSCTYTKVEYNYDEEVAKLSAEYDKNKRDCRYYESGCNVSYKKHCAKDLRHKNKEVINKILKDDMSWEDKPFPDTYLGKQYIWDYW